MSGTGARGALASRALAAMATVLMAVLVAAVAPGGAVQAIYPIPVPEITTDSSVYSPGDKTTITLVGFVDCPQVIITIDGPREAITAVPDEDGRVTVEIDAPEDEGSYEITATCITGDQTATTTIEVSVPGEITVPTVPPATDGPTSTTGSGSLPTTGSDAADPLRAGLVLVGAGAAFVLVTRRRAARSR